MANSLVSRFFSWIGGGILRDQSGQQMSTPSVMTPAPTSPDAAMQISTVYACVSLLSRVISSLPLMIYENQSDGRRKLARDSRLWMVLHSRPNDVMTPRDFWSTMVMHWAMRGNAYAQIIRDSSGDLVSLWPLSPDQTEVFVDQNGQVAYKYQKDGKTYILGTNDVLHIKDIGNGLIGLSKLSFMSSSVKEATET